MERYAALLRGINISGRNQIAMTELKCAFEGLGLTAVHTHLNSGNVVFDGACDDNGRLLQQIEGMIQVKFGLDIPVFVISQKVLQEAICHAPDWWGNDRKEIYDNLIFVMEPATSQTVCDKIGAPKDGLEQIMPCDRMIFWSFSRKDYQKTNWWPKTAGTDISRCLTIRTAGTVRKICSL